MEIGRIKQKLRDLRRLERRFRGLHGESQRLVWDDYFTTVAGACAQYPLITLSALDRESRRRVFAEYLTEVFAASVGPITALGAAPRSDLLAQLGLPLHASDEEIRREFRARAKELHPDLGGEADAMAELLRLYTRERQNE